VQERPTYLVVADELRERIQSGQYPPGARLPTMEELRRAYGVSEIVIRHAVSLLRHEGLVETRRGGGTVVRARPQVRRRAMERYTVDARQALERYATDPRTSFTEDHAIGWSDYRLTTSYAEVTADEELAALFGAGPGTPLLRRHFVFYVRGEPQQISVNYLPLALVAGTPVADPAREPWPGGTVAQLAFLGRPVSRVEEAVSARMPSESEVQTLQVAPGVPVFAILRRLISGEDVLEVCRHIVIAADRVVLEYGIDLPSAEPANLGKFCPVTPGYAGSWGHFRSATWLDAVTYQTVTCCPGRGVVPVTVTFCTGSAVFRTRCRTPDRSAAAHWTISRERHVHESRAQPARRHGAGEVEKVRVHHGAVGHRGRGPDRADCRGRHRRQHLGVRPRVHGYGQPAERHRVRAVRIHGQVGGQADPGGRVRDPVREADQPVPGGQDRSGHPAAAGGPLVR
jgi:GntR family transcriptional regulator